MKVFNSTALPILRVWTGQIDFVIIKIDDFDIMLEIDLLEHGHSHAPTKMLRNNGVQPDDESNKHPSTKRG